jgi:GAF domain-containing protein
MFLSTLDQDEMLVTALEQVRQLLDVVACSIWLVDPVHDELICRQATGPQRELVRGWRLAWGEGLVGWVARHGESLNVPDVRKDPRHYKGVDQRTGLPLRAILTVPLQVKGQVLGVIQTVDARVGRFTPANVTLIESLAVTAAAALENARLYEQVRRDAAELEQRITQQA